MFFKFYFFVKVSFNRNMVNINSFSKIDRDQKTINIIEKSVKMSTKNNNKLQPQFSNDFFN